MINSKFKNWDKGSTTFDRPQLGSWDNYISLTSHWSLANLGGMPGTCPHQGSRFFHFDIQNFRNITTSGIHDPPCEVHIPLPPLQTTCAHAWLTWWKSYAFLKKINFFFHSLELCVTLANFIFSTKPIMMHIQMQ